MAEDDELDEEFDDDVEGGEGAAQAGSGKKRLFIIIGVVLLLVVGGVAGAYFTGMLDPVVEMFAGSDEPEPEVVEAPELTGDAVFYDLPEMLVNLNTGERKATFLKIRISLELSGQNDVQRVEEVMPRIIDNFQVYLRELRIEDLKGSAGMYRLREELLTRVSAAVAPVRVNDILFKEMLIQ